MRKSFFILSFSIVFLNISIVFSQDRQIIDSLHNQIKEFEFKKKQTGNVSLSLFDSTIAIVYSDISYEYWGYSFDTAKAYADKCLELSNQIGFKPGIAKAYNCLGFIYGDNGEFSKAINFHQKALKINQEIGNAAGEATSYNNLGLIYDLQGNYLEALKNYFLSLNIRKALSDIKGQATSYSNISIVYTEQANYSEGLKYALIALKFKKKLGSQKSVANSYSNIAGIYLALKVYSEAIKNYSIELKIRIEIGDMRGVSTCYSNIGQVLFEQKKYQDAVIKYLEALNIAENIDYKEGIVRAYGNLGIVYNAQKKYEEALKYSCLSLELSEDLGMKKESITAYLNIGDVKGKQKKYSEAIIAEEKALSLAIEIGALNEMKDAHGFLADINSKNNDYKNAYFHHVQFKKLNDSIFNVENSKQIGDLKTSFEVEKKEVELKAKAEAEKEKLTAIAEKEKKQQQTVIYFVILILLLVLIGSGFLYNRFKITQKQKAIIESQKQIVVEKNHEITQSIQYALRIQTAILPPLSMFKSYLPNSFILYKPKDIVAGDFYWLEVVDDLVLFAACDCTGHGVPGAMVSVICHNALNRSVREFGLTNPAKILDKTAEIVTENFSKSEERINDGMDISLCSYNVKTKVLNWSGANNPLFLLRNGELEEIKANKQPIGASEYASSFNNHTFELNSGDFIYIFSDGFADQFGGENGEKKLTKKRFKNLLLEQQSVEINQQEEKLNQFILNYRKNIEQIDDILVIGVQII